jgi:hypothetical protein
MKVKFRRFIASTDFQFRSCRPVSPLPIQDGVGRPADRLIAVPSVSRAARPVWVTAAPGLTCICAPSPMGRMTPCVGGRRIPGCLRERTVVRIRCLYFLLSVATWLAAACQSAAIAAPASDAAVSQPASAATATPVPPAAQLLQAGGAGPTDSSKKESSTDCCADARLHRQLVTGAGVVAALLAIFAMGLTVFATWQASRGAEGIHFRSYWGGFGGSGSGWELTPPAVSLIAAALLASTSVLIIVNLLKITDPKSAAESEIRHSATATPTKN